ncbi:MAG: glycoside hydrolase family 25 protein [Clostridia bacterium]|nr:glycoside hydrolase family 25 protein [Clostridia bacterium]
MKKILAFTLSFIMIFQVSITALAFSSSSSFTKTTYTHDDRFADREIVHGLDISVHQGTISDFTKIKAAGVDFMFLRAAYRGYGQAGSLNKDTMFAGYAKGALKAGIDIGAYIYSQAITVKEAQAEADYILNIVKDYDITLPIVLDYEYASGAPGGGRLAKANLSDRQRTDICLAFCERVEKAGYTACVYANRSMFDNDLYAVEISSKYVLWLAQYNSSPVLGGRMFSQDYSYWQYSSDGSVNGISGRVDCNFRYFKAPEKVQNLKIVEEVSNKTTLSWDKVKDCYGYEIYKLDGSGAYTKIGTNKGAGICTFTDTYTTSEASSYKVKAISRNKGSFVGGEYSDEVKNKYASNKEEAPDKITMIANGTDYATFKWLEVAGATEYHILRATSQSGEYETIAELDAKTTSYTDHTGNESSVYYYRVKSIVTDENGITTKIVYSPYLKSEKPKTPQNPDTDTDNNEQPDTDEPSDDNQDDVNPDHMHSYTQEIVQEATCSDLGVAWNKCSCGDSFKEQIAKASHKLVVIKGYKATCLNEGLSDGSYCSECGVITKEQEIIPITDHVIKTETKRASYFEVGYKSEYCAVCDEEFKFVKEKRLSLKVPTFKVKNGKKQFKVTYKKVTGATGFQVRYRIKGKWVVKTYKTKKQVTKTIKKLKTGTYKVQIRAMTISGKMKAYSKWAKVKKVVVK